MAQELKNIYYVKNSENGQYTDVTNLVDGVRILKIDGFFARGKPVNIYTSQWINSQTEDFLITTLDEDDNPIVVRENVDISITFIVSRKYAANQLIDVAAQHDNFVNYLTNSDIWVRSFYANKEVHCVCIEEYKPTVVKLQRGISGSYIMGTINLHCLDDAKNIGL